MNIIQVKVKVKVKRARPASIRVKSFLIGLPQVVYWNI